MNAATAAMLAEAEESGKFGVELGSLDAKAIARELVTEGFGEARDECVRHGLDGCPGRCNAETFRIFLINDDGRQWLVDNAGEV